jgi:hypothetical protein
MAEREHSVADLGERDVQAMAAALGVPLTSEDLTEVTHRLNAFIEALRPLDALALEDEPVSAPIDPDRL